MRVRLLICVIIAAFTSSSSAQTPRTTAAEAEAAIGTSTPSAAQPDPPGLSAPPVAPTLQAPTRAVLQRPAGTPIVVPSGTLASAAAHAPSAPASAASSSTATVSAAQVRPGSLSIESTSLAPSPAVAPPLQSAPATTAIGEGGELGLAPSVNVNMSQTSAVPATPGAASATLQAVPNSGVRTGQTSPPLAVVSLGDFSSGTLTAAPAEASLPMDAAQSGLIRAPANIRSAAEFEETLAARYAIDESSVSLEDRPEGGVEGHFSLHGDLTPASARSAQIVQQGPRAIAEIFLAEEAASLGIADTDDLRESVVSETSLGWTGITYHRFVGNLQLENAQVSLSIDPQGAIRTVSGYLVPLPDALFTAAARPTISEDAVHGVIRNDLVDAGQDPNGPYRLKLIATSSAPYVIWKSSGTWIYRIDAFTGEILEKRSGIQSASGMLERRTGQEQ